MLFNYSAEMLYFSHMELYRSLSGVYANSTFENNILILPLAPLWVGSVSNLSLWLVRLKRRWIRPRRRTLSSLSEDGMDKLLSSSKERSESESESSPDPKKWDEDNGQVRFVTEKQKCNHTTSWFKVHFSGVEVIMWVYLRHGGTSPHRDQWLPCVPACAQQSGVLEDFPYSIIKRQMNKTAERWTKTES